MRCAPLAWLLAALGATCSACVNTPAGERYALPAAGAPTAEIVNAGMSGALATVDGKEAPVLVRSVAVAPGAHRLGLNCLYTQVGANAMPIPNTLQHQVLSGDFAAGRRYYVRCTLEEGKAHVFLSASPEGPPLEGFE